MVARRGFCQAGLWQTKDRLLAASLCKSWQSPSWECLNGIEEVVGSIPSGPTKKINTLRLGAFGPLGRREPQGDQADENGGKEFGVS
jgi:hypothetical protein